MSEKKNKEKQKEKKVTNLIYLFFFVAISVGCLSTYFTTTDTYKKHIFKLYADSGFPCKEAKLIVDDESFIVDLTSKETCINELMCSRRLQAKNSEIVLLITQSTPERIIIIRMFNKPQNKKRKLVGEESLKIPSTILIGTTAVATTCLDY